jgi:hypothetical protein
MTEREPLIDRVRGALDTQPSTREVRMFGKVAFMVNEKMVVAVGADDLLVRVDPDRHTELTGRAGAAQAEMGAGRSMGPGWISLAEASITDDDLQFWLQAALQHNAAGAH